MLLDGFSSAEYQRALLEDSPIPTAYVSRDGVFVYVNDAWCDLVGYSRTELQGMTFGNITHHLDLRADEAEVNGCLADPSKRGYAMGKRYVHKIDGTVWANLVVRTVWINGSFRVFVAYAMPVPNHGRFKAERQYDGKVEVRPSIKMAEFVADNWKTLVAWGGAVSVVLVPFAFRFAQRFMDVLTRLGIEW